MRVERLLFVCSGNTCRSPMAAGLFQRLWRLEDAGWDIETRSAGTNAMPGFPASTHGVAVMQRRQIDLTHHRSVQVNEQMLLDADLVLTMTRAHKDSICQSWPQVARRVYTMLEYAGRDGDVIDPFGGAAEHYEQTAVYLENLLGSVINRIRREGTSG